MSKILITGATGAFGKAAIEQLLKKGIPVANISALARDEGKAGELQKKGVDIRIGDYDDYESLLQAFSGIEKLLLVSGTDLDKRVTQHRNVVDAAKEKGVNHIYYTSFERKNESDSSPIAAVARSHMATESRIKEKGLTYTFFRNNIYTYMIPIFAGEHVTEKGLYLPAGETGVAFALRQEMAEASANAISEDGHENKEYSFSSPENVSFPEIAKMISEITGKNVPYINPDTETYIANLKKAGVPEEIVLTSAAFAEGIKQGEFHTGKSDLEELLGRKPTSVREYLEEVYG